MNLKIEKASTYNFGGVDIEIIKSAHEKLESNYHPGIIRPGMVPKWLEKVTKAENGFGPQDHYLGTNVRILDHFGIGLDENAKEYLISEPYGTLGIDDLKILMAFCEKNNCRLELSAESFWFPGNTMCIKLFSK